MKKLIALFLVFTLLCTPGLADGDSNIDGGGGGTGSGDSTTGWNPGEDGVRVTILEGTTPISILDYANKQMSKVQWSFKKQCKLYYKNGGHLTPHADQYKNIIPTTPLPNPIVTSDGSSKVDALKNYFTDRATLENLSKDSRIPYDDLVGGKYKLMLETIAYFKYKGVWYAMTATEASLFDTTVSNDLRYQLGKMTHQNLPFSMFLERADLGIQPWPKGKPTSGKQSNIDILNYLGVGIVSFKPNMPDPTPPDGDYNYRTDTDVITAFLTPAMSFDLTPDAYGTVTFSILGNTYNVNYVCPASGQQLVWVRWHTPTTPQNVEISVDCNGATSRLTATISDIPGVEPPDPVYDGPDIGAGQYQPNFRLPRVPTWGSKTSTEWREWAAVWVPAPPGSLLDGWWEFYQSHYSVALTVQYKLVPDERVETAFRRGSGYEMKSGYGVNAQCQVTVAGAGGVSNYDVTPAQNVVAVFPEFQYKTYNRILQPDRAGYYNAMWGFKPSEYSYYLQPVHFTPLWYPDRTDYAVPLAVFDAWTPGGQLYATVQDSIYIDGNVYDDGYIRLLS